nr:unnamed protein product [Digitaria exilis]
MELIRLPAVSTWQSDSCGKLAGASRGLYALQNPTDSPAREQNPPCAPPRLPLPPKAIKSSSFRFPPSPASRSRSIPRSI